VDHSSSSEKIAADVVVNDKLKLVIILLFVALRPFWWKRSVEIYAKPLIHSGRHIMGWRFIVERNNSIFLCFMKERIEAFSTV
jgi:hypothetical protein